MPGRDRNSMLDFGTPSHLLHDPGRDLDALLQRLGGRSTGEPAREEARAQGVTGFSRVHHPDRSRRQAYPLPVSASVQGAPRAELEDDAGIVAEQLLRDEIQVLRPAEQGAFFEVREAEVNASGPFEEALGPYLL